MVLTSLLTLRFWSFGFTVGSVDVRFWLRLWFCGCDFVVVSAFMRLKLRCWLGGVAVLTSLLTLRSGGFGFVVRSEVPLFLAQCFSIGCVICRFVSSVNPQDRIRNRRKKILGIDWSVCVLCPRRTKRPRLIVSKHLVV